MALLAGMLLPQKESLGCLKMQSRQKEPEAGPYGQCSCPWILPHLKPRTRSYMSQDSLWFDKPVWPEVPWKSLGQGSCSLIC